MWTTNRHQNHTPWRSYGVLALLLLSLVILPSTLGLSTPKQLYLGGGAGGGNWMNTPLATESSSSRGGALFRRRNNSPPPASSFHVKTLSSAAAADREKNDSAPDVELMEHKAEASNLFGNVRIPAALFAGASAGAAFALPITPSVGVRLGLVQRLYSLLMMGALSYQILAVVVSTLAVASLATRKCPLTASVGALLQQEYELEWVAVRFHFLCGLIMFITGIGLRAWIAIACPVIAKAALGVILSSAALCVAFIQDVEQHQADDCGCLLDGVVKLPTKYLSLLAKKSMQKPLFAIALIGMLLTSTHIVVNIPHVVQWLAKS
jgi:hypothetical protein